MTNNKISHVLTIRLLALFMISLLISLPLVSAADIGSIGVRDSDGFENVVRASDTLEFDATVLHSIEQYTDVELEQRLQFGSPSNPNMQSFDNCTTIQDGKTECTLSIDSNSQYSVYDYRVSLYTTSSKSTLDDDKNGRYYVDTTKPNVAFTTFKQQGSSFAISFDISDTVSEYATQRCSGLTSVTATVNGEIRSTYEIGDTSACNLVDSLTVPLTPEDGGIQTICLRAVDGVGLITNLCRSPNIDLSAPSIQKAYIGDLAQNEVSYISSSGKEVKLYAKINGNFDPNSVYFMYNGERVEATCAGTVCQSNSFTLSEGVGASVNVVVSDATGNTDTLTAAQTVSVDTTGPSITSISSTVVSEGIVYFSDGADIIVTFTETESGFSEIKPKVNIASQTKAAQSCEAAGTTWTCIWPSTFFTPISDGDYDVSVTGTDDARNSVSGSVIQEVRVDRTAPEIEITSLTGLSTLTEDQTLFLAGGSAVLNFTFSDISPINYTADFSAIGGAIVRGNCAESPCQAMSEDLSPGGKRGVVIIKAADAAGNVADPISSDSVYVLKTDADAEADYFTHSLILSPGKIETTTSSLLNHRAYATVSAVVQDGLQGEVRSVAFIGCQNEQGPADSDAFDRSDAANSGTAYIQEPLVVDLGSTTETGILFNFRAIEIREDNISFDCDVSVSGIIGDSFVSNETETVKIFFDTYELAVGSVDENYESELEAAIDDAQDLELIGTLKKWFDYAVKLCQLLGMVKSIMNTFSFIGVSLAAIGVATTPFGGGIGVAGSYNYCTGQAANIASDGLINTFSTICQYVTCEKTLWDLGGGGKSGGFLGFGGSEDFPDATPAQSAAAPSGGTADGTGSSFTDTTDPNTRFGDGTGNSPANSDEDLAFGLSPKQMWGDPAASRNNLVLSIVNLCIPGILENLDKQRQIKCRYALCLLEDVSAGTPKQVCDDQKEYAMCVYVYGQILGLLPIAFLNAFISKIKAFFTSPMALINGLLSYSCVAVCAGGNYPTTASVGTSCYLANFLKQMGALYSLINSISNIGDMFASGQDYCSVLEDKIDGAQEGSEGSGGDGASSGSTGTQWG